MFNIILINSLFFFPLSWTQNLKKNKEVPITNLKEKFHLSSSAVDLKRSDFFYLPFLESIVNTSSFSDDANGVNKIQRNLGRKLFQLGFET